MTRVLFVCVENSNRSQMAEAFSRHHGTDVLHPWSAGSQPSGRVNPRAIQAMAERGIDLTHHTSKGLDDIPSEGWDYVITMGCGDVCPYVPAVASRDWDLPDPRHMDPDAFRGVRDAIESRVLDLLREIRRAPGDRLDAPNNPE